MNVENKECVKGIVYGVINGGTSALGIWVWNTIEDALFVSGHPILGTLSAINKWYCVVMTCLSGALVLTGATILTANTLADMAVNRKVINKMKKGETPTKEEVQTAAQEYFDKEGQPISAETA